MHADIEKILLSETQIAARITELACELNNLYKGEAVCIVGVTGQQPAGLLVSVPQAGV